MLCVFVAAWASLGASCRFGGCRQVVLPLHIWTVGANWGDRRPVYYEEKNNIEEFSLSLTELELTFTHTLLCPWSNGTVDLPLCEGGRTETVSEHNKVQIMGRHLGVLTNSLAHKPLDHHTHQCRVRANVGSEFR